MTTPRMVVIALRKMIRESGLGMVEFAAFSHVERRALWQICTSEDERYLPNLGTCLSILYASARMNAPKQGSTRRKRSEASWAKDTLKKIEELTRLYEEARTVSRRRSLDTQHNNRPPIETTPRSVCLADTAALPDWIKDDSA